MFVRRFSPLQTAQRPPDAWRNSARPDCAGARICFPADCLGVANMFPHNFVPPVVEIYRPHRRMKSGSASQKETTDLVNFLTTRLFCRWSLGYINSIITSRLQFVVAGTTSLQHELVRVWYDVVRVGTIHYDEHRAYDKRLTRKS